MLKKLQELDIIAVTINSLFLPLLPDYKNAV